MKKFQNNFDWTNYFTIEGDFISIKEGKQIEFKESFQSPRHKDKKLLKWIASFANAEGGLIIYGVDDNRKLVGLSNNKLEKFDNKDLTQELNNFFSPEIEYELFSLEILSKKLGFLYVYESKYKPVITTKTGDKNVIEGDIYYRYSGQSKKILYPELRNLLKREYDNLNNSWIELIKNVATVGVENVGILNINSGEISGKGGSLFLDRSLLSSINFIKEGSFDETAGSPTLKVVGKVVPADSNKVITVTEIERKAISKEDIYNRFLDRDVKPINAYEYLRDIINENSKLLPIYYFMHSSGKTKKEIIEDLKAERGINKKKILSRIDEEVGNMTTFEKGSITYDNRQSKHRLRFLEAVRRTEKIPLSEWTNDLYVYFLQSITHLKIDEYDPSYLNKILKDIYKKKYEEDGTIRDNFRRAICHLDLITYGRNLS